MEGPRSLAYRAVSKPCMEPSLPHLHSAVLYCTVLYCTVLYCTVLYCTELWRNVLYCTALYGTVLYRTVRYCTVQSLITLLRNSTTWIVLKSTTLYKSLTDRHELSLPLLRWLALLTHPAHSSFTSISIYLYLKSPSGLLSFTLLKP